MRIVIDTNIMLSRFLSPFGAPAYIYDAWRKEIFDLVVSEPILQEYQKVLLYKQIQKQHGLEEEAVKRIIFQFRKYAVFVKPQQEINIITDDPDDNKFVATALEGKAEYIISKDKHLLSVKEYQGIYMLGPIAFLEILHRESKEQ